VVVPASSRAEVLQFSRGGILPGEDDLRREILSHAISTTSHLSTNTLIMGVEELSTSPHPHLSIYQVGSIQIG
jgi:hypothetical protein